MVRAHTRHYELRLTWFVFLVLGFVFLDRIAITFLLPIAAPELHLNNAAIGQIMMWMTLAFDASALCFGALSDRSGRRKAWLVPFVLATSVFSGLSAVAASFTSLLLIRLLNGAGEGPTYPLGAAMLMAESAPERVGRNLGFAQSGVGLIGLALGPLLVTQLAVHTNWRWAFLLASVPSFVLAFVLIRWTREVRFAKASSTAWDWRAYQEALSYRNVWVCVFMSICLMVALWVMNIFAPLFLTQVDHLSEAQMGYVMSIMGLGAFFWGFLVPLISDYWGRKPTMILFSFVAVLPPLVMHSFHGDWVMLAVLGFFLNVVQGLFPLFMNIVPMETVPERLAATASALSMSVGEMIGAAATPAVAGALADVYGLPIVMWIAAAGPFLAALVGFAMRESNLRKVKSRLPNGANVPAVESE